MASLHEAQRAKQALKTRIGRASWIRGIGISGVPGNYGVKVLVDDLTHAAIASIPSEMCELPGTCVPVTVEAVGKIRALVGIGDGELPKSTLIYWIGLLGLTGFIFWATLNPPKRIT